jgi:hypothetical protein
MINIVSFEVDRCLHPASQHRSSCDQVYNRLREIGLLAMALAEAWEQDGNRDADSMMQPWPFSVYQTAGGGSEADDDEIAQGLSIDEWAAEVMAVAEEYRTETR